MGEDSFLEGADICHRYCFMHVVAAGTNETKMVLLLDVSVRVGDGKSSQQQDRSVEGRC
jgi:hypothetical protein